MTATEDLVKQLQKLSQPELRDVLEQLGIEWKANMRESSVRKGLTPGLLRGTFSNVADDFDDELPEEFWVGEKS